MNGGGSERGRHRIWNRLQALSCQHRARRGAWTHGPRDHDLSRSRPLNRLSHPGAPMFIYFWERQRQNASGLRTEREGVTFFFNVYFWEREREAECERTRSWERGRHRIQSRLQAPSCQHRAQRGARTHEPWDHDLSWSQLLNRLSHPGTPELCSLNGWAVWYVNYISIKLF